MNAAAASSQPRHHHPDQWVLVDARLQLLAVGSALYNGTSPRTGLDLTARHLLIPRLRAAAASGRESTETAHFDEVPWEVRVVPVLGPVCRQPLAMLGCYGRDAEQFPSPPVVGSWEWRVTPPGPEQQMRTYWSESLFDVYGLPKPSDQGARNGFWEGPQWLDELIAENDRAEVRKVLDEFLNTSSDALFLHTYGVRNPTTGERHTLRLAGRSYVTEPGPPLWLRGISTRIDHLSPPDEEAAGTQEFLNAAFMLTADPLCAIDVVYEHIYMTTPNFADLGIALPAHRHLPAMCHPEDLSTLRNFLRQATSHPTAKATPAQARFQTAEGEGWQWLTLTGTGVRLSADDDRHHVLCRVTHPAPD